MPTARRRAARQGVTLAKALRKGQTTRGLKKLCYRLLRNLHDLERGGKRRTHVIEKTTEDRHFAALMIREMSRLYRASSEGYSKEDSSAYLERFVGSLDELAEVVEQNCRSSKPLEKGYVSAILTQQTITFHDVTEAGLQLQVDNDRLHYTILAAVSGWGDYI
jgi:hypothetical protein